MLSSLNVERSLYFVSLHTLIKDVTVILSSTGGLGPSPLSFEHVALFQELLEVNTVHKEKRGYLVEI